MEKLGKRYIYVIANGSNYDGLNVNVWFASRNKKEAIRRFKWLHDKWISNDYTNDEGDIFAEHNYNVTISDTDPNYVSGYFYYYDDDGESDYILKTIKTDGFFGPNQTVNERAERYYFNDVNNNDI